MDTDEYKFEIRLKDPDVSKTIAMLAGIQAHFGDGTMKFYETKVIVCETRNKKVAEFLSLLNTSDNETPAKKNYRKRIPEPETVEV